MYKTLEDLIQSVHIELRLVPGASTQVYAEDFTKHLITTHYYDLAREPEYWWDQFMSREEFVPDGVTGKPTTDFNSSDNPWEVRHEDIRGVWPINSHRQLARFNSQFNPSLVTFTRAYVEFINDPLKLLRILPVTSTERFTAHVRRIPKIAKPGDLVLFDSSVIINKVAWVIATNDGVNPQQGITFLNRFEVAFNRVKLAQTNLPSDLDMASNEIPTQWYETPAP